MHHKKFWTAIGGCRRVSIVADEIAVDGANHVRLRLTVKRIRQAPRGKATRTFRLIRTVLLVRPGVGIRTKSDGAEGKARVNRRALDRVCCHANVIPCLATSGAILVARPTPVDRLVRSSCDDL